MNSHRPFFNSLAFYGILLALTVALGTDSRPATASGNEGTSKTEAEAEKAKKAEEKEKAKEEARQKKLEEKAQRAKEKEEKELARKKAREEADQKRLEEKEQKAKQKAEEELARKKAQEEKAAQEAEAREEAQRKRQEEAEQKAREKQEKELAREKAEAEERAAEEKARKEAEERKLKVEAAKHKLAIAQELLCAAQPEKALEVLNSLSEVKDGLPGYDRLQANAAGSASERTEALKAAEAKVSSSASDMIAKFQLGFLYYGRGRFADGVKQYEAIVKQDPNDHHALINLGYGYRLLKDYAKGEGALGKAIDLKPNDPLGHVHLAELLAYQGQNLRKAQLTAQEAYRLAPWDPQVLHALGFCCSRNGQHERALDLLGRAARKLPDEDVQYHYAEALAERGKTAAACKVLGKVIKLHGSFEGQAKEMLVKLSSAE